MRVENFLTSKIKIIQDTNQNNFTQDSLLLYEFVDVRKNANNVLELCAGNGVISLLLSGEKNLKVTAVEIQEENCNLFKKSLKQNNINEVEVFHADVVGINRVIGANKWDLIVCNPPYYKINPQTRLPEKESLLLARFEHCLNLNQLFEEVRVLLSNKGEFYFIHEVYRLSEILALLSRYKLYVKKMQFVYTGREDASRVLICACKNSDVHTKVLPPLYK